MDDVAIAQVLAAGDDVELGRLVTEDPDLLCRDVPGTSMRPLSVICFSPDLVPESALAPSLVACLEVLVASGEDPNETHQTADGPVPALVGAARNPDAARLLREAGAHPL
jgi:hypothetical protein